MGRFVKGDVVVVPFPFSDLTANKKRLFTADSNIILYRAGVLSPRKVREVVGVLVQLLNT